MTRTDGVHVPRDRPKVAATGLSGMIGRHVHEILPEIDWEPVSSRLDDSGTIATAVENLRSDIVVNFAAFTDVSTAWRERADISGECYQTNVIGTRRLASACAKSGKFLVHISTDYVFSGERSGPYYEQDLADAEMDWYGFTKRKSEEEVRRLIHPDSFCIVRISSPFQARSTRKEDVVRRMIRQISERTLPPMFTDTLITPTYIDGLKPLFREIVTTKPSGTFHAAGPDSLSPYELALLVARTFTLDETDIQPTEHEKYVATGGRPYPQRLQSDSKFTTRHLGVTVPSITESLTDLRNQIKSERPPRSGGCGSGGLGR